MNNKLKLIAALGSACLVTAAGGAFAANDAGGTSSTSAAAKRFMKQAVEGDNAEIALGHLATERAGSNDVKSFGQMLEQDHSSAKQTAMSVASSVGAKTSEEMPRSARRELKRLQGLSGAAFDREFVAHMIKDHQEDIAKFKREASRSDGSVSDFARDSVPTLQKHLDTARNLARTASASVTSTGGGSKNAPAAPVYRSNPSARGSAPATPGPATGPSMAPSAPAVPTAPATPPASSPPR